MQFNILKKTFLKQTETTYSIVLKTMFFFSLIFVLEVKKQKQQKGDFADRINTEGKV
ncbi:hypothetical protein HMPREF0765_2158 [Sphingobacterium spiritivorum ATCC 33300]|uniref:Uncharacterized protein n=1 Tax=Sphingobacterium spiritivorum ATCC 33300 TaxID=525372 RepID=C2FXV2_SPHSI|nr:hypothetical protein HMPREF0765_2158 [Sphingobacterium spiritivorum ATCC 33300]